MEYKILERDAKLGDYNAREGADTTKEELFEIFKAKRIEKKGTK